MLQIYNTLTRRKEPFQPRDPERVSLYFCGPTPYSHTHIGHLRPALTGDVIARYLEYKGYRVQYLSNFTDIDDKIIHRSHEAGVPPLELSDRYSREYLEVMAAMGIDQVARYAKVTEHMPEIIEMVRVLVEKGAAYPVDGDVYYDVTRMADYGKLSGRRLEDMLAGARVVVDERKHHPMDFALWKSAKPGEPAWDSPWGPGRPGWHIECSAMSLKYLGNGFDIHGGGDDLIFPHHENEIAQSEAYTGCPPFARYWVHNGMIQIDNEKMSKSLGNFITAKEMLERFSPQTVRYFMLSTHYRNPLNFSWQSVEEAGRGWERLENTLAHLRHLLARDGLGGTPWREALAGHRLSAEESAFLAALDEARQDFETAMDDDFNTALALAALFELARKANSFTHAPEFTPAGASLALVAGAAETLARLAATLGFRPGVGQPAAGGDDRLVDGLVELAIELRQAARQARDWSRSDLIRDRLAALGVVLEDTAHGTRWKKA